MTEHQKCERKDRQQYFNDFSKYYKIEFTQGDYDRVDFYQTALTQDTRVYVGELKAYFNEAHPRFSDKFPDYQLDFSKIYELVKAAKNKGQSCTPLLVVYFTNELVIWDLSKIPFEQLIARAKWINGNKSGVNYGEKEWDLQTYLYIEESVYRKPYSKHYEN